MLVFTILLNFVKKYLIKSLKHCKEKQILYQICSISGGTLFAQRPSSVVVRSLTRLFYFKERYQAAFYFTLPLLISLCK